MSRGCDTKRTKRGGGGEESKLTRALRAPTGFLHPAGQHAPSRFVGRVVGIDDEDCDGGVSDRTGVHTHDRAAHRPGHGAVADLHVAHVAEARRRVRRVIRIEAAPEVKVDDDDRTGVGDLDWWIGKKAEAESAGVAIPVDTW